MFAYITARHESSIYPPFEVMFWRNAVFPVDVNTGKQEPDVVLQKFQHGHELSPSQVCISSNDRNFCTIVIITICLLCQVDRATAYQMEVIQSAKANILAAQEKQKEQYNCKHCIPGAYQVGAKVLLKDSQEEIAKEARWILSGVDHIPSPRVLVKGCMH